MKVELIEHCGDCPCMGETTHEFDRGHDSYFDPTYECNLEDVYVIENDPYADPPPDWCPLRKGDVTIRLKLKEEVRQPKEET